MIPPELHAMPERAAVITVLLIDRPLCVECIANRTGMSVRTIRRYLGGLDQLITVDAESGGRCRACRMASEVFSLPRPE